MKHMIAALATLATPRRSMSDLDVVRQDIQALLDRPGHTLPDVCKALEKRGYRAKAEGPGTLLVDGVQFSVANGTVELCPYC